MLVQALIALPVTCVKEAASFMVIGGNQTEPASYLVAVRRPHGRRHVAIRIDLTAQDCDLVLGVQRPAS